MHAIADNRDATNEGGKAMRKVLTTVTALALTSSCSMGIKPVDPNWDGTTEPECDQSSGLVVLDYIAAGLLLGVAGAAAEDEQAEIAMVAGVGGLAFAIAGITGGQRARECREANAQWRIGGSIGRASRANARSDEDDDDEITAKRERTMIRAQRKREAADREVARQMAALTPRGHFCATSPSNVAAGLCAREKTDCERARGAALGAVPDMGACTLTEKAWCFDAGPGDERCSPTVETCAGALASQVEATGECVER